MESFESININNEKTNKKDSNIDQEGENEALVSQHKYTEAPCNKASLYSHDETLNKILIVVLFFITGSAFGYFKSVVYDIHEHKVTYKEQSLFSIAFYPMWYKMVCAVLLDIYFVRRYGKAKTYLVVSGCIISVGWMYLSLSVDGLIEQKRIVFLTVCCYLMNQVMMFFASASDCILLKSSHQGNVSKHTMIKDIGFAIGELVGYNIFLPFNSVEFLNSGWIPTSHRFTEPLVTHRMILNTMGVATMICTFYLIFFYRERIIEDEDQVKRTRSILKSLPKYLSNPSIRTFLIYLLLSKMFRNMISTSLTLRFMDFGFSKALVSLVDSVSFPIFGLISYFILRKLMTNRPMKVNQIMLVIGVVTSGCKLIFLKDLELNNNKTRSFIFLSFLTIIEKFAGRTVYFNTFVNTISPIEIGPTFISLVFSIDSLAASVPSSIGLMIISYNIISYYTLVMIILSLQILVLLIYARYSFSLDHLEKGEFDIMKESDNDTGVIIENN